MGFQQGLSGLNASSKNLDVIGHNIANANTVGFKGSRSEFAEIVANSLGASGGGGSSGIGVTVSTAQQFTQGNISITGNSLDVAINGDGFFIVDMPANTGVGYTRSGDFKLDSEGNLITKDGGNVRGITYDLTSSPPTPTGPGRLSLPVVSGMPAQTTTTLTISANLDADAVTTEPITTYGTSVNVYDSLGSAVPVNMYFQKSATANTWNIYVNPTLPIPAIPPAPNGTVTFSNTGAFVSSTVSALSVPTTSGAATPIAVTPDWSGLTQFADTFSITDVNQDGRAPGKLTGFAIESDGFVKARFSNGESLTAGQVQLARFRNNQGLNPIGANYWVESNESGNPTIGNPASNSLGALRSGALEDSNVDITAELVNMIVAQRSYQANAQTIKTQDQVLSTLVNLR